MHVGATTITTLHISIRSLATAVWRTSRTSTAPSEQIYPLLISMLSNDADINLGLLYLTAHCQMVPTLVMVPTQLPVAQALRQQQNKLFWSSQGSGLSVPWLQQQFGRFEAARYNFLVHICSIISEFHQAKAWPLAQQSRGFAVGLDIQSLPKAISIARQQETKCSKATCEFPIQLLEIDEISLGPPQFISPGAHPIAS